MGFVSSVLSGKSTFQFFHQIPTFFFTLFFFFITPNFFFLLMPLQLSTFNSKFRIFFLLLLSTFTPNLCYSLSNFCFSLLQLFFFKLQISIAPSPTFEFLLQIFFFFIFYTFFRILSPNFFFSNFQLLFFRILIFLLLPQLSIFFFSPKFQFFSATNFFCITNFLFLVKFLHRWDLFPQF